MNRVDRMRFLAALEAAAGIIRAGLKKEAADEHAREGVSPSWTAEGVTVSGSQSHDHAEVEDNDELMAYLVAEHPEMITTVVVPRNPEHLKAWLAEKAKGGPVPSALGKLAPGQSAPLAAAIPGVVFVRGGVFGSISVRVDSAVKRTLAAEAQRAVAGGASPALADVFQVSLLELEATE
jgi:hypothetical protein